MPKKAKGPLETVPIERLSLDRHDYDEDRGTGRCRVCKTPEANRLHKPDNRAAAAAERRRAEMARLGEREDED